MRWLKYGLVGFAVLLLALGSQALAGQKIALNVVTAGDTNMHELQKDVFGPAFSKQFPNCLLYTSPSPRD